MNNLHTLLAGTVLTLAPNAQTPQLLADINQQGLTIENSYLSEVWRTAKDTYLAVRNRALGTEVYHLAADRKSVSLLLDLEPGTGGSAPRDLVSFGGVTLFLAKGSQVWRTDGTTAGTRMVGDFGIEVLRMVVAQRGLVLFMKDHSIYVTDGTVAGTRRAQPPGTLQLIGDPNNFGQVVGVASTGARAYGHGMNGASAQLWESDGTVAGTRLISGNEPIPLGLLPFGTKMLLHGYDIPSRRRVIRITGAAGTVPVADFAELDTGAAGPAGHVFVAAKTAGVTGIWLSNGTAAGTREVLRLGRALVDSTVASGLAVFLIIRDANGMRRLYHVDTVTGKVTQPGSAWRNGSSMAAATKGTVMFTRQDSAGDQEFWRSDGTAAGTVRVKDLWPSGSSAPTMLSSAPGGWVVFSAYDGVHGNEPWISDGTPANTRLLGDIEPRVFVTQGSAPRFLLQHGGLAYFEANSPNRRNLVRTDGTPAGTRVVGQILDSQPAGLGKWVYYYGRQPYGLFRTDGTVVEDLRQVVKVSPYGQFVAAHGFIYFRSRNELWRTDGTAAGTTRMDTGLTNPSTDDGLLSWNGKVFYPVSLTLMRVTDGTTAGTFDLPAPVTDLRRVTYFPGIHKLYFQNSRAAIFSTDGTAAGTRRVYSGGGVLGNAVVRDDKLYFSGTSAAGQEPWISDGTTAGTRPIADIFRGPASSLPTFLGVAGTAVLLVANDGLRGPAVWRTDGTGAGTVLVKDIQPDAGWVGYAQPAGLSIGDRVYFVADDRQRGAELWQSDGTAAGTSLFADVWPGQTASNPRSMMVLNGRLLFGASHPTLGWEPWAIDMASHALPFGTGCGTSPVRLSATAPRLGSTIRVEISAPGSTRTRVGMLLIGSVGVHPLHLGFGCSIYVDMVAGALPVPFAMPPSGQQALSFAVPNTPSLHGLNATAQAALEDPRQAPLGLGLSRGLTLAVRR